MTAKNRVTHRRRGVAVVEFLFAAPAFFILVFFVIEIALVWNDRHVMRLAAYRAARSVVKSRFDADAGSALCWRIPEDGSPEDANSQKIHATARRAASKVMATITPSVTQLMTMFHVPSAASGSPAGRAFDDFIESASESQFGSAVETVASNPYVHAITRVLKGLPAAWIFTELTCEDVQFPSTPTSKETGGVEVKLTYHRSAKMPYIGTLMWMLRSMQQISVFNGHPDDGTSGIIRIDPLHYGLRFNPNAAGQELSLAEEQLKNSMVQKAQELGAALEKNIKEVQVDFPPSASGAIPQIFGSIAGDAFGAASDQFHSAVPSSAINWVGNQALDLFIAAPEELKTIPVSVSVRLPNFNQAYANAGNAWKGESTFIGRFYEMNIGDLAKAMQEVMDIGEKPNSGDGLPYTEGSAL